MESIQPILQATGKAANAVRKLSLEDKKAILIRLAALLNEKQEIIIQENKKDLDKMEDTDQKKDRLLLNESRINDLANSLHDILKLEDPAGAKRFGFRHLRANRALPLRRLRETGRNPDASNHAPCKTHTFQ